jgi:alpha-mannosidase
MITVHMIGNAHLDPVWLWRWPSGVAEVLATCRTACDLLDAWPQFVFTRSDVWVHERIEELDPGLFARIRRHMESGRWAVVGGWYIQPDCNFPREESFERHIETGRRYFGEKLGLPVTVGYNVDSFGHAGSLPRILSEHGYDSYVMMRPKAEEKALPSALFRWRSDKEAGGEGELLTWRIPASYCTSDDGMAQDVQTVLGAAIPGVDHVMCFYGVGDHGGGPTRAHIEWIIAHQDSFPGARLVFSHPRAFFDAVGSCRETLPIVTGELNHHAIGCYSVEHRLKKAVRAAEHGLHMAQAAVDAFPAASPAHARESLDHAWKTTLFNQFHDIYGGASISAACEDALAQLSGARDSADSIAYSTLFRHAADLPPCRDQIMWVFNASDQPFEGYVHWEPWVGWNDFNGQVKDRDGRQVPIQVLPAASITWLWGSLLWPASLAPRQLAPFLITKDPSPAASRGDLSTGSASIANGHWEIRGGEDAGLASFRSLSGKRGATGSEGLAVRVLDDPSDTWSHGIDRYAGRIIGSFKVHAVVIEESGPLRASMRIDAGLESSSLSLWLRLYQNDPRIEMELRLDWHEKARVAKLLLPLDAPISERTDGIPGGGARRPQDARECPLVDWTQAHFSDASTVGIACPDCSALDGEGSSLGFTLVRSPAFAWHLPTRLPVDRIYRFTDQGEHEFRFTLLPGADARTLDRIALAMHRPPLCIDWTKGM